ncbi:histidine phosphatase family protein [Roseivirga sp. E12]|uniref:histidine phosphatase family protein n=1 Tax=Roseivirga sp. E12 TaxID=2819237 RepID=UPI001ABBF87B|nr:histidine phosphatase family protein [Roseivirga sp. E12]MBO3700491.1 histidine phosphatase family protein [Roseivirga sp. E12]
MTKKIYLTRHGQTDYNKIGVVQGSGIDSDLNALGQAQGEAFFSTYKHIPFKKVYISALKRTYQSVVNFIEKPLAYEKLADLNEISWGEREGIPVDEEGDAYYLNMIKSWQEGRTDVAIDGGENPEQVAVRMHNALEYILSQSDEDTILICMHGRAMRVMLAVMLNYPLKCMDLFEHSNLCLYELTYTGSMFIIDRYNDTSHLVGLDV